MTDEHEGLSDGSNWLRFDAHVHTPASHDYGDKGTDYQVVADAINDSHLDIVAVTDHWTLDGYRALKPLVSKGKLLLPGIELKLDKNAATKSGYKGGFHAQVIFPEDTDPDDIQDKFLNQLKLCETDGKLPTRKDILALGKSLIARDSTEEEQWKRGSEQAYVDLNLLSEKAHQLGGVVVIPYDRHGGFEAVSSNNASALKTNILKCADFIETNDNDVRIDHHSHEGILAAAGKKTPALKSSDAHKPGDIGGQYTWIKGEKSLEGIKQALYFPSERVSFEVAKPAYSYPRIKTISLSDATGNHPLVSLDGKKIPANDNLTSIIGHPSIGKSTLMEVVAYLFGSETSDEIGEKISKVDNIGTLNPDMVVSVEIEIGGTTNTLSRNFRGVYGGDIAVREVPITYLNQGYIDRTARDPSKVEELIEDRMDVSELEAAEAGAAGMLGRLQVYRNEYLRRAVLLAERKKIEDKQAAANKFFEISKSKEYLGLEQRRKDLHEKESKMNAASEAVDELLAILQAHEDEASGVELEVADITKHFPSIETAKLQEIIDFPSAAAKYLNTLSTRLKQAPEIKGVVKQKKQLQVDVTALFQKENITYTQQLWDEKDKQVQHLETQKRAVDAKLAACDAKLEEFNSVLDGMNAQVMMCDRARETAIQSFNKDLGNVEVRYEQEDQEPWLIKVLTEEAKLAWDKYTDGADKKASTFRMPSEESIRSMLQRLHDDGKKTTEQTREHLISCLEGGTMPTDQDTEFMKWLFGDRSEVIRDFLKMRLREYVAGGQLGLYYDGKNIAKEGLSYTERCGALLEVIIEKGVQPLIIDQPEDNLGSSYISDTLIPTILRKKHERQIILISHNPNTVVLSDSDLVVAFDRDVDTDTIDVRTGAIECGDMKRTICDIIEGGVEAFKTRSDRYKIA